MDAIDQEIAEQVIKVIERCTGFSPKKMDNTYWKEPLTGYYYNFSATDLVYILLELERELQVKIPPEDLEQYGFSTIDKICTVLERHKLQKYFT